MLFAFVILLVALLGCAGYAAPVFLRLARQLTRTGAEVEKLVGVLDERFLPRAESMVGQTTRVVSEIEGAAASFQDVRRLAGDVLTPLGEITVAVEAALHPYVQTAGELGLNQARVRALGAGVRTAWGAWKRPRGGTKTSHRPRS